MQCGTCNSYLPTGNYVNGGSLGRPDLTNTNAPLLPIMHDPTFSVPWQQFPLNWTYSSISFQVPFMYPVNETIGYEAPFMYPVNETIVYEVIPHQHSLPFVPTYQFPHISLVPGAERIVTRENMVNTNFAVQQANFPMNHPPRFAGVDHGPGLTPLHPYNSHMGLLALQAQVGHVSRGLSEQVIVARMKCIKYESTERLVNDIDTCCICLEDFSDGQLIGSVDCRHSFHFDCIRRWLMEEKNICPLCNGIALTI